MTLYQRLLRPAIFRLSDDDPERAHEWVMGPLAALSTPPLCLNLPALAATMTVNDPRLCQRVFGVDFPNPVGLAGGFDKNAVAIPALAALGFGFVEAGTVTHRPQPGNPRPRVFRLPEQRALINRMGFNNDGAATVARRLARMPRVPSPVGISLGKSQVTPLEHAIEDYRASFRLLAPYAAYVAINVSSPNTPGLRTLQEREQIDALLGALMTEAVTLAARAGRPRTPLLVKVAPDLTDAALDDLLDVCAARGVDGIIAVNTTVERSVPPCPNRHEPGGLSGRPLHARALAVVRHIHARTRGSLPIIGVGGIFSAADAYAMMCAGASLVQVYTGMLYEGPSIARAINRGLLRRMTRDGIRRLSDLHAAPAGASAQ